MTTLYARSNAEAHLYMDQQPCPCGAREAVRASLAMFAQAPATDPCERRPPPSPDDKKS